MPTETKYFETENGVAIGNSILLKDDAGKATFSDIEITSPLTLKKLITAAENTFNNSINGFVAVTVQAAIEEAYTHSYSNDRYPVTFQYGGSAGVGRYLECFSSISSDEAPHIFPENGQIKTVTAGATALSTGVIGFFKTTDLVNPVFTITFTNEKEKVTSGLSYNFNANEELCVRITSGSMHKPYMRVWINNRL
jgi:hypothetical protein